MGIKLFLNIFLNVDNTVVSSDKIRSSRRLTDVLTSYCVVCACVDVVCLLMNIRWVKRYCRIQKLVRPFYILYAIDRHRGVQHTITKKEHEYYYQFINIVLHCTWIFRFLYL